MKLPEGWTENTGASTLLHDQQYANRVEVFCDTEDLYITIDTFEDSGRCYIRIPMAVLERAHQLMLERKKNTT